MTYFLLPKSHSLFNIVPSVSNSLTTESCCSHSLGLLYHKIKPQFDLLVKYPQKAVETNLHSKSELFNDLLEIINTINLFDSKVNLNVLHVGKNSSDTTHCVRMVRGLPSTYEVDSFDMVNDENHDNHNLRYDFLCVENESIQLINRTYVNSYIISMFKELMVVLKHQKEGGSCIIKIYQTVHKPIIEFLYILSFLFNKISVIKPKTSDPTSCVKYIVCKNFLLTLKNKDFYEEQYSKLANFIDFTNSYLKNDVPNIISLIDQSIPYYFINKIDDMNVIIGQQQLEHMNQTISSGIHLGIDLTKKQKTNSWNEKGNFHYNKGMENKGNIFLQGGFKKEDLNRKTPNGFLCNKKLLVDDNVGETLVYNGKFTLADSGETEHTRSTNLEVGLVHDTNCKTESDYTPSCFDIV